MAPRNTTTSYIEDAQSWWWCCGLRLVVYWGVVAVLVCTYCCRERRTAICKYKGSSWVAASERKIHPSHTVVVGVCFHLPVRCLLDVPHLAHPSRPYQGRPRPALTASRGRKRKYLIVFFTKKTESISNVYWYIY